MLLRVAELRDEGLSAVTINTYLRSANGFADWMVKEGHTESHAGPVQALRGLASVHDQAAQLGALDHRHGANFLRLDVEGDAPPGLDVGGCSNVADCFQR